MTPDTQIPDATASLSDWLAWLEKLHPVDIEMGLDRVSKVARQARLTEQTPTIITVGGTNGKGSVVAMLTAFYLAAGFSVGAYTSPHLVRFNERMKINGEELEDAVITAALHSVEIARGDISLTYFEYTTLAAMQIFKSRGVDIALMEVGLGGRLDAVNLWDTDCAIITSVALDHESYLGSTRDAVATEKVAIARAGKPLVIAEPDQPVALRTLSESSGAVLYRVNDEYHYELADQTSDYFVVTSAAGAQRYPMPSLVGKHQLSNAAAAIMAATALSDRHPVSADHLAQGLLQASVAGRFQQLSYRGVDVFMDVAHNPAAAEALASALAPFQANDLAIDQVNDQINDLAHDQGIDLAAVKANGKTAGNGSARPVYAVVAMMADKDITAIIDILLPRIDQWFCGALTMPRAMKAAELAQLIHDRQQHALSATSGAARDISVFDSVRSAFEAAVAAASTSDDNALVLVFGSFFTVGEILGQWTDN